MSLCTNGAKLTELNVGQKKVFVNSIRVRYNFLVACVYKPSFFNGIP